jgi:hypothetical protein
VVSIKINNKKQQEQSLPIPLIRKGRGLCFVFILLVLQASFAGNKVYAQEAKTLVTDTIPAETKPIHSPRKATIYALVLPGAGQAYNHKYWKIPIVYIGFGTMIYFIKTNSKYYHELKDAHDYVSVTLKTVYPPTPPNMFPYPPPPNEWATKGYTEDQLKEGRDYYRRNLEISYLLTGVWYILTVVDANVDAHFFDYSIDDNLTLRVDPWLPTLGMNTSKGISGGVNLSLRF